MSLLIRNTQKIVTFDFKLFEKNVNVLREIIGLEKFKTGILCIDNETMEKLNSRYRKSERPTDILAFPFHQNLTPGMLPVPEHPDEYNLGDIFLGLPYIAERSQEERRPLEETMTVMVAHGLCELLGYTHNTDRQWEMMFRKELAILERYNKITGAQLQPMTQMGH